MFGNNKKMMYPTNMVNMSNLMMNQNDMYKNLMYQNNLNNINMNNNMGNIGLNYNNVPNSASNNQNFINNNNYNNNYNNFVNNYNNNFNNNYNNNFNNNYNNNFNHNFNNNFNINQNLKMKLFNQCQDSKDPYFIQRFIGRGLNNNQPYKVNVFGGNKMYDFFFQSSNNGISNNFDPDVINVSFKMMQGHKHIKVFKSTDTIKYMLETFVKSFGLHTNTLKKIYFLHNAINLNSIDQNKTLKELKIKNTSTISVIDTGNIIGALKNKLFN